VLGRPLSESSAVAGFHAEEAARMSCELAEYVERRKKVLVGRRYRSPAEAENVMYRAARPGQVLRRRRRLGRMLPTEMRSLSLGGLGN